MGANERRQTSVGSGPPVSGLSGGGAQPEGAHPPTYVISIYIVVTLVLLALLAFIVYVCCSKRYRLNWFERTLLDAQRGKAEEKARLNLHGCSAGTLVPRKGSTLTLSQGSNVSIKYVSLRTKSIDSMGSNPSSPVSDKEETSSPPPSLPHTPQRMGSYSGSGAGARGSRGAMAKLGASQDRRDSQGEFWVPPTIIQKKRAQSLIPQILQVGSSSIDSSKY